MQSSKQPALGAAEYYDERHARGWMDTWPESKRKRVVNLIQQSDLDSGARILEYGCGVGVFADALKRAVPSFEVHGCDISSTAIDRARERCPDVIFHLLSDEGAGPPVAYYDLVYTHHVLEHVQDLSETLEHISRVLKPNGKVLHIVPCANADSLEYRISRLNGKHVEEAGCFCCDDSSHVRRLTKDELVDSCVEYGLVLKNVQFANQFWGGIDYLTGEYHWTLLAWLDPRNGVTPKAKLKLFTMLFLLTGLSLLRKGPGYVLQTASKPMGAWKKCLSLLATPIAIVTYPLSAVIEKLIQYMRDREWNERRYEANGSEMYGLFEKPALIRARG